MSHECTTLSFGLCRLEKRPSKVGERLGIHLLYPLDRCRNLISRRGGSIASSAVRIVSTSAGLILLPFRAVPLLAGSLRLGHPRPTALWS